MNFQTLTSQQLEAIGMDQCSYILENGGIGLGYRMPISVWKTAEAAKLIWVSNGNGTYSAKYVKESVLGDTLYMNQFLISPENKGV